MLQSQSQQFCNLALKFETRQTQKISTANLTNSQWGYLVLKTNFLVENRKVSIKIFCNTVLFEKQSHNAGEVVKPHRHGQELERFFVGRPWGEGESPPILPLKTFLGVKVQLHTILILSIKKVFIGWSGGDFLNPHACSYIFVSNAAHVF